MSKISIRSSLALALVLAACGGEPAKTPAQAEAKPATPATPGRTQVPFALTHEALANLADDIAG